MKFVAPILAVVACVAMHPAPSLRAQGKPPAARQFLLDEYRTVIHVDLQLLRDTGVWDEMAGSALKLVIAMIEKELSYPLARLDRITTVQRPLPAEDLEAHKSVQQITTLEGNGDLGDPDGDGGRYRQETVGEYQLLLETWGSDAVVQVSPKLRVHGPTTLLRAALRGKPRTGLPSADVLSFTAGKNNLLAYLVADVKDHRLPRESLEEILPDAAWPDDDKPTHMCMRVLATGDEDDPHLMLEWAVRHGKDGNGLVATEKAVAAALQRLRVLKEARILRPLLKKVVSERDGTDAVWRVDLGRARHAMGLLGTLAPFMMFASASEVQVVGRQQAQLQVIEEVVEEVVEEPKPKKTKAPSAKKVEKKTVPVTTGGGT